ncbi:MAG TPA: ribbon-helix-helix protein, CopG family [Thermoanaerobaculia bacterium]|nr:ribbon-helix-helix protein, CopG family [Thermoanaerobaculia bacterium]
MTTTISLEDELAQKLDRLRQERALSFDEVLNQAIREGLARLESPPPYPPTVPVSLGECLIQDLDDVSEALAVAEGEDFR